MRKRSNLSNPAKVRGAFGTHAGGGKQVSSSVKCNTRTDVECTAQLSSLNKRHLRITQSDSNFLKFLNEDRQGLSSFCDLTVTVCGKKFSAHKVVLAFGSSYFHTRLSTNPQVDNVTIDHMQDSVFQQLLCFLYTSEFVVADSEIPSLAEAARLLEMMAAVKLLTGEGDLVAPSQQQEPSECQEEPDKEQTESSPESCPKANQTLGGVQCSICNRTFCYKKSLENHLAKSHSRDQQGSVTTPVVSVVTTRRSTRQRKTPTKLAQQEGESDGGDEVKAHQKVQRDETLTSVEKEDDQEAEEREEAHQSNEGNRRGSTVSTVEDEDRGNDDEEVETEQEECEEEHVTEDNKLIEVGVKAPKMSSGAGAEQTGHATDGQVQAADGSGHVYPEGLAPVVIQSSSKKTLKCPKCDKTFDRIGKYESHTRVHTGEKPFQCDICLQRYSTKSNLTVHKKKHASDAPIPRKDHKCPFCNKLHASRKTLAKHVRRFHPDHVQEFLSLRKRKSEGWKCDICHKSFTRRPHLEEHMILHSQDRPFKCAYCDDYFKSRFARLKHQEKYHLGPFPCDICGRQFNDTGNRKRHIECTHGGKRKWTCFLCGKSVRERTTLREHLRIHSGEKPHLCSICGQSFRHGSSYRLHLRVHHDDKRYECDECGKTFIRHDHLTKHRKIHSGEKAHQCEECGKCFRRHDHLTVHYKSVHLGEKVWQKYKTAVHQCEVCKKEFKGKSSLEMHFRTHSGEKPYRCLICQQTFRIKKTLTKHMVIHSDARPYNCPHCSATFKRKDKLKYHVDHVHSTRMADQSQTTARLPYTEPSKPYPVEPKSVLQGVTASGSGGVADVCVPVTLVPVQMPEADLAVHGTAHGVLPAVQTQPQVQHATGYQPATDLVFLEKYTLTPQPANIVHPVRPDQMLDPREQSYLGTLLGLDTATPVQSMSNTEHVH
ncbi:zinc finger and BTB domain-containing protein 41 [Chanos chanos]|uniref:Zinc finger and BTB domain-containing protein 41 n=1 Tax=Chanos chanos TaxID=29144 RepID=A0A6J2VHL1_CHACN|nr:zinc finger and BTB domain-containing protein 41 [Chanos chanos]